mgnify:CR=1 FL=1
MAAYIAVTLVVAFISVFLKICLHIGGVAVSVIVFVFVVNPLFVWTDILLIPIGWSRDILKKHTFPQIVIGSGFSILLTYLVIRFFS